MTYFFGIQFVGSVAATLSSAEKMDFVLDEDDPNFIPSPLRDMGKDTERLLKVLPCQFSPQQFLCHLKGILQSVRDL